MVPESKKNVLFICTHNSARSQMAEGLMNHYKSHKVNAFSAGTKATQVHPLAIEVMKEAGIDISNYRSKTFEEFKDKEMDYVVTVCDNAKENCPFFPSASVYMHMGFQDPASVEGTPDEKRIAFRNTRDAIKQWLDDTFQ